MLKRMMDYFGFAKRSPRKITARLISIVTDFWKRQMLHVLHHAIVKQAVTSQ